MTFINFTKMHSLGNDFVFLNGLSNNLSLTKENIRHLADRHYGIGCDQVLVCEPPQDMQSDFFMRIYNLDGSESEQCGNGARCFIYYVRQQGFTSKDKIQLQTNGGLVHLQLIDGFADPSIETEALKSDTNKNPTETEALKSDTNKNPTETGALKSDTNKNPTETEALKSDTNKNPTETEALKSDTNKNPTDAGALKSDTNKNLADPQQKVQPNAQQKVQQKVQCVMGTPDFNPNKVLRNTGVSKATGEESFTQPRPFVLSVAGNSYSNIAKGKVAPVDFEVYPVSFGNPHLIIFQQDRELANQLLEDHGEQLATHPQLINGANIGFISIGKKGRLQLQTFERGSGRTLACGSNASAAYAVVHALDVLGETSDRNEMELPGGKATLGILRSASEGRKEGASEGRKEGASEGRKEGASEGRKEGASEGRKEGASEGRKEGINRGTNEGTATALNFQVYMESVISNVFTGSISL